MSDFISSTSHYKLLIFTFCIDRRLGDGQGHIVGMHIPIACRFSPEYTQASRYGTTEARSRVSDSILTLPMAFIWTPKIGNVTGTGAKQRRVSRAHVINQRQIMRSCIASTLKHYLESGAIQSGSGGRQGGSHSSKGYVLKHCLSPLECVYK